MMAEHGYSAIFEHIEMHDQFLGKMSTLLTEFLGLYKEYQKDEKTEPTVREFVKSFYQYVTKWYQEHISNVDSKYAYIIRKKSTV